jgi:hypothetical protein
VLSHVELVELVELGDGPRHSGDILYAPKPQVDIGELI